MRSRTDGDGAQWGQEAMRGTQGRKRGVGGISGLLLAGSLLLGTGAGQAAEFIPLGFLPGDSESMALGVSADGSVVVGRSGPGWRWQAFRWANGTMTDLGFLPGGKWENFSQASGVSADGSVVVGTSDFNDGTSRRQQAFRWTAGTGMTGLGDGLSSAYGVSADGSVVVGSASQAFRWEKNTNTMTGLGILPGGTYSAAIDVSADGSVVVGTSDFNDGTSEGPQAFRWTAGTGMTGLGFLPEDSWSQALGISADGSVVVGTSSSSAGTHAFRWTAGTGMIGLGFLPGGIWSVADGVSGDGSVVVGWSDSSRGQQAFIWDQAHGMRSLLDMLITDYGLGSQVTGWSLRGATAISPDGRHIVGWGVGPNERLEAWLVRNLNPVPLPAAAYLFGAGLVGLAGLARRRTY